jgi:hypothetical protein
VRIIHPGAQQLAAIDDIDRAAVELVLVREIGPQRIVGTQPPQSLEGERDQPPGPERGVVVVLSILHMHLQAAAEVTHVLVERGLEPA